MELFWSHHQLLPRHFWPQMRECLIEIANSLACSERQEGILAFVDLRDVLLSLKQSAPSASSAYANRQAIAEVLATASLLLLKPVCGIPPTEDQILKVNPRPYCGKKNTALLRSILNLTSVHS